MRISISGYNSEPSGKLNPGDRNYIVENLEIFSSSDLFSFPMSLDQ